MTIFIDSEMRFFPKDYDFHNIFVRFRTLFYLHNARSMLYVILVTSHIFEIAESYLAADIQMMESISTSPLQIVYAWFSIMFIAALITFVRFAEIYDRAGGYAINYGKRIYLC